MSTTGNPTSGGGQRSGATGGRRRIAGRRDWRLAAQTAGIILRWVVLIEFIYVFLFPLIFMVATSLKTVGELNNPTVHWISRSPSLQAYEIAFTVLKYMEAIGISAATSVLAAAGQTLAGAMIAYGFARMRFPGRDFLFGVLLFSIVIPLQTVMIPQFILFTKLKWMNTYLPLILPAWLGFGVRGGILLIVFRQFFRGLPYELEDAAYVDGAGPLRTFGQIMLPLAKPGILVVFLFSLVWTWNDLFVPSMVLRKPELLTLPQRMLAFVEWFLATEQGLFGVYELQENILMAGVTLTVIPMLVVYIFAQRYFTQSVDRTGLVE